jgi:tetratricopeptide (TPR) repeat protein
MVPDYYARLEVDPRADRAEIEAALQRKQPAWSMGTRNPKNRHTYQLYLDEIPALRRALLSDLATRAAYDAELAVAQRYEREGKLDELQRRVRLRAAKGGLGASDRDILASEAERLGLIADDLVRLIRPIPNLAEAPNVNGDAVVDIDPPADVLDPSTRRQIQAALEHLGCRDLYGALGVTRDATASDIAARADAERQRWMKKAQVTAEKTAWLEVIAHAQSHLGSPRARSRYDRTLTLEAEEAFDQLAEFTLKGLGRLDAGTRAALIAEAAALGIATDRADRLIGRVGRRTGVASDGGPIQPVGIPAAYPAPTSPGNGNVRYTLLRCRNCGGVTEISPVARKASSTRCPHCGTSLRWDCPVCRRTPWVDEPQCACGFRMAMREPVIRHFEAAQQAFRGFEFTGAIEHLERVLELAPDYTGARNGLARVRQRQADLARLKLGYHTARAGGRLAAARLAVEAWSRLADPQSPEIQAAWSELTPLLRRAEALVARARQLERSDPPTARNFYLQSLGIAADLPDALAGLARTPPDPPTAMDAQVLGDRIRLVWTPPPADGCGPLTFVVIRKRNGVLAHPGDGTRIAEVNAPEFDDLNVPPGETVGYAVLSKRGSVESIGAISLGPFIFLADVKDVHAVAGENDVELTWKPPPGVTEVRVVRKRALAPSGPRDGDRLAAALDHSLDSGLDANQVYYYGVFAIYKVADGRLFPSPGVVVSARPGAPLSARPDPPVAESHDSGLPVDPSELRASRAGGGIGSSQGAGSAGGRVTLRWRWAPEAASTMVVARQGTFPEGPNDPLATTAIVSRGDYDRLGCAALTLPASPPQRGSGPAALPGRSANGQGTNGEPASSDGGPWHIRVYSVVESVGGRVFSPGLDPSSATILPGPNPELTVSYALKRPWLPGAAWSLTFHTEPAGAITPPLVVVAHPRAVPLSVDDGQIVARIPAAGDGARVPIASPFRLNGHGVRVFLDPSIPPDLLVPIRFRHPETSSTRV